MDSRKKNGYSQEQLADKLGTVGHLILQYRQDCCLCREINQAPEKYQK
ncbi:MAG: hypothetical protein PHE06_02615 [Lachnospiraceae bacterium]|nr:hypothetical protein [Lachnospiraceae bacterium]MDD3794864.1 hypothetical protein [Lachnospiraceae bacterium]